jgi:hypothetical protein
MQRTSRLAIASLVCAVVPFLGPVGPIAGIVLGILALRAIKRDDRLTGQGLAIAGIVYGAAMIVGIGIFVFVLSQWRD